MISKESICIVFPRYEMYLSPNQNLYYCLYQCKVIYFFLFWKMQYLCKIFYNALTYGIEYFKCFSKVIQQLKK